MQRKIFLIEDDLAIMDFYSKALKDANIDFEPITLGKEALRRIQNIQEGKEEKPVLVLLDLILPDVNGLEILYKIREHAITKDITVFVVSNYTSEALLNIDYIKPDKFILKTDITPLRLVELVLPYIK
jgi:DNA-binding response OmpR family regulator